MQTSDVVPVVDRDAQIMLGFLVANLDLVPVPGGALSDEVIDRACDALFPGESDSIRIAIDAECIPAALHILADFASHADSSAVSHQKMLTDGEDPPCSPDGCRIAANACRVAHAAIAQSMTDGEDHTGHRGACGLSACTIAAERDAARAVSRDAPELVWHEVWATSPHSARAVLGIGTRGDVKLVRNATAGEHIERGPMWAVYGVRCDLRGAPLAVLESVLRARAIADSGVYGDRPSASDAIASIRAEEVVSLAEVAIQRIGDSGAREIYCRAWDEMVMRRPPALSEDDALERWISVIADYNTELPDNPSRAMAVGFFMALGFNPHTARRLTAKTVA